MVVATGFAFEITAIDILTARVVLRDGDAEFRVDFDSYMGQDGLAQFLRAVFDVVDDRLWGAVCYWARDEGNGWFVDVRQGDAWREVTIFDEEPGWPPAGQPATAVFQARIDDELDLARVVAAAFRSVLERYGAASYEKRWAHPFPLTDLDALNDWIRRQEAWGQLYALQAAVLKQSKLLGTRVPETIAAALGESPERVAEAMRLLEQDREYAGRPEIDWHYVAPPDWL